jgi:YfiH family protein
VSSSRPTEAPDQPLTVLDARLGPGIRALFTTRYGGVSAPPYEFTNLAIHLDGLPTADGGERRRTLTNLQLLAATVGAGPVHFPQQVHGSGVHVVGERPAVGDPVTLEGAHGVDALVTRLPRVPLGVRAADCMPVLLADPVSAVVGAAHAGRRGLVLGVLQNAVAAMAGLGAEPHRICAVIGPSVCGRCYEVPAELCAEVDAAVPGTATTTARGTPALDLQRGAMSVLDSAGVGRVGTVGICTMEDERFYSYRRSAQTGRFAGVVMLATDD